ncbi:MAG: response regulator [Acidihalobacter sp.]|uniref:HD domain-containing phosphohydrolase n=1 Tax=Acidihalobacter sp. TaxID=1872108 RepID=UPI00307F2FC4
MNENDLPRILCVDDEPKLLSGLERALFDRFDVSTAPSGEIGLAVLERDEPFAVIVSDMRMPGMDGAAFLARARELAPDSVRILLTGQADTESAISAINQGAIFRFLCKPCPAEELISNLDQAVTQYRLIRAERELLETTLAGTVKTLTEVLAMAAPWAFERTAMIQACVRHVLDRLNWPNAWTMHVAAALSQIGCVSVPSDIVQREIAHRPVSEKERELFDSHPEVAHRLLASIPRLEKVAEIVRYQAKPPPPDSPADIIRGAQLLRAALLLVKHTVSEQMSIARAIEALKIAKPAIAGDILQALSDYHPARDSKRRSVRVHDLVPGWVVEEDVRTTRNLIVLKKGNELSLTAIITLRNLLAAGAIEEPLLISCPAHEDAAPGDSPPAGSHPTPPHPETP